MPGEPGGSGRAPGPWHPFLFSVYPALFLYLRNIREVSAPQALWAAAASLVLALALWPATRIAVAAPEKRALVLLLFLLLFHSYGLYHEEISGLLPAAWPPLAGQALALAPLAALWLLAVRIALRARRIPAVLGRSLNLAAAALLAWSLAGILLHHARALSLPAARGGAAAAGSPADPPDIYCFVLDEFLPPESALRLYGHDNGRFVAALRRLGFFVAEGSLSRFARSEPAIADILNLGEYSSRDDPNLCVRRNAVAAFLKARGYRVTEFACIRPLFMDAADRRIYTDLSRVSLFFDDYYRTLFERSLLRFLPEIWKGRKTDLTRFYRRRVLQVFDELPAVIAQPGRKFVYVHLLAPHEPFVFAADGGPGDPGHLWDHSRPEFYLRQYAYVSRRMEEAAALILRGSRRPPVILLQSDHGYRGSRRRDSAFPREEMLRVFNALYLPGVSPGSIARSLPPRENFRLVFNLYFGTRFPPLPSA